MRGLITGIISVLTVAFASGGCGGRVTHVEATIEPEAREVSDKPVRGATVVYSSAIAVGRPAFGKDKTTEGPLKMLDGRKAHICTPEDFVEMADVGMYTWIDRREPPLRSGELRQFYLGLENDSRDTLIIDTVLVPDSRFEIDWEGRHNFPPGWNSGMRCYLADSTDVISETIEDYRLVVIYGNKGIAPQTFHFNIHPDINKLRADYAASQAK